MAKNKLITVQNVAIKTFIRVCNRINYSFAIHIILNVKLLINIIAQLILLHTLSDNGDYISLTDIARNKNANEPKDVVKNWVRSKTTIEFLGLWEQINNTHFKGVEFDSFMNEAGSNSFTLSPSKWIESTGAVGIITKQGKSGGTYAHKDIAFEFASWVSAAFKLYLVKEFQRLKEDESNKLNLESINAMLIHQNISQKERLVQLNQLAISQMKSLIENITIKKLENE